MGLTSTYTYAILAVSESAYQEIMEALRAAGYDDQFHENDEYGVVINMQGVALAKRTG